LKTFVSRQRSPGTSNDDPYPQSLLMAGWETTPDRNHVSDGTDSESKSASGFLCLSIQDAKHEDEA
jgi:hypothetical protein